MQTKTLCLIRGAFAAAAITISSQAAPAQDGESAASASTASAPLLPAHEFTGLAEHATFGFDFDDEFCGLRITKYIDMVLPVTVLKLVECNGKYGRGGWFYQVAYDGQLRYVDKRSFSSQATDADLLTNSQEQLDAATPRWLAASKAFMDTMVAGARKNLNSMERKGIVITSSGFSKASELAEGTNFSFTVVNPTKKCIKYVTVNVVGYNAVNDPVRGHLQNSLTMAFKGIGPVQPGETASWERKYMWSTDSVKTSKIVGVKVDYMDGSSTTIKDPMSVQLTRADESLLSARER